MKAPQRALLADLASLALCLAALGFGLWLRSSPASNGAALFFAAAVLVAGLQRGPMFAWILGLGGGLFVMLLCNAGGMSLSMGLVSLAALGVCTLFPIPWTQEEERLNEDFERKRQPLEQRRDFALEQLNKISQDLLLSEQRSREIDALYHAGREISKRLTLEDTLDFCREIIRDTLQGSGTPLHKNAPLPVESSFVLVLVDEENAKLRVGIFGGMDEELAGKFEAPLGAMDLVNWLKNQGKSITIPNVAAEPRLKGIQLLPQLRGFSSIPLLIQEQVIGLIVVLDFGDGRGRSMEGQDFSNLRILTSQVAIGIEKATLYDKVQRLSITDGLTGLFVHRHFQARLDEEMKRAERYKESLSLIMLDIDHFKKFNDSFGHLAGDAVLKRVAQRIREGVEHVDIVSRYGGEEFVVILPKRDKGQARLLAEKIRQNIEKDEISYEGKELKVTVSSGLASFPDDAMTKKGLIDKADQALYRAKHDGRNRVMEI